MNETNKMTVGSLKIIFGPMFSGKTTMLIKDLETLSAMDLNVLYINHCIDIRESINNGNCSSHKKNFNGLSENVKSLKTTYLENVNVNNYDVIGVDEAHFFSDLEKTVRQWVLEKNKIIILSSLDGTYDIKSFGQAKELICLCEPNGIMKLSAYCTNCNKKNRLTKAGFSFRINKDVTSINDIGGIEKYTALCLECHKIKSLN